MSGVKAATQRRCFFMLSAVMPGETPHGHLAGANLSRVLDGYKDHVYLWRAPSLLQQPQVWYFCHVFPRVLGLYVFFLVVECLSIFYGLLCSASIKSPSKVKCLPAGYKVSVCWRPSQSIQPDMARLCPAPTYLIHRSSLPLFLIFCPVDGWGISTRSRASAVSPLKMSFNTTKNDEQSPRG